MSAVFSPCRRYRYRLDRDLGNLTATRGAVAFVGLNASVADEEKNDPTIRREIGFARAWGFAKLIKGNAYGLASTDPRGLWRVADPVGPDNDGHIEAIAREAELVVCAWGGNCKPERSRAIVAAIRRAKRDLYMLGENDDGSPRHPLYLRASLTPVPWSAPYPWATP